MKVKKDYQVIISPLLQSMLGFRQAIFRGGGGYVSDWVADLKKGLNSLYMYCPLVEPRMVGDAVIENRTGGRKRRRNDHQSV